jgi:microcystin-dependent protein
MANFFEILLQPVFNTEETLVGGTVDFYDPGTTGESNRKAIYTDQAGTIPAANPYTLSANATAALYGTGKYHIIIKDSGGVTKYDYDYYASSTDITTAVVDAIDDAPALATIVGDELIGVSDGGVYKSITIDQLATFVATAGGGVSTGDIIMWPTVNVPTGYVVCDGTVYATATYPVLGALLGATFGGNGTSSFGVPDLKGRSPIGVGDGDASGHTQWDLAEKGGSETHPLTEAENGPHTHDFTAQQNIGGFTDNGGAPDQQSVASVTATQPSGSGTAHNNVGPVLGLNFIIKT